MPSPSRVTAEPSARPAARGRVPALVLVLTVVVAACSPQALAFSIGDCVNLPDGEEISSYESIDCAEPHDGEVFALPQHPDPEDAPYPGPQVLQAFADERCVAAFEPYVGIDYDSSAIYVTALTPTEVAWDSADDREVVCLLVGEPVGDGFTQLVGSKQGSQE